MALLYKYATLQPEKYNFNFASLCSTLFLETETFFEGGYKLLDLEDLAEAFFNIII